MSSGYKLPFFMHCSEMDGISYRERIFSLMRKNPAEEKKKIWWNRVARRTSGQDGEARPFL
jgi:hypothetical protein